MKRNSAQKAVTERNNKMEYWLTRSFRRDFWKLGLKMSLFLVIIFFMTTCAERTEGCFDAYASNYSLAAEKKCGDCCTYPQMRLELRHRAIQSGRDSVISFAPATPNATTTFSTYTDAAGNPFAFQDLRFYISNFWLINAQGDTTKLIETLPVYVPLGLGDTLRTTVEDNVRIISNPGTFSGSTFGTFRNAGTFTKLRFTLGVTGLANKSNPNRYVQGHPLGAPNSNVMYRSPVVGYNFSRFVLQRNPGAVNSDNIEILVNNTPNLVNIEMPINVKIPQGFNVNVILRVDHLRWFKGVNVRTDQVDAIASKIVANLPQSFQVVSVSTSQQ
jgi:hypothetical protein